MSSRRYAGKWAEEHPPGWDDDSSSTTSGSSVDSITGKAIHSRGFARQFPLIVGVVMLLVLLIAIINKSGGPKSFGEAKAVVFVFEGFKGTAFQNGVIDGNKAPHMKDLARKGTYAACVSTADSRCARTQSGADHGSGFTWTSAPGIASILSGVDSGKHQVKDNSLSSMLVYSNTSQSYPSFVKLARSKGVRTAAIGTSHLLNSVSAKDGRCSALGILDLECGAAEMSRCMRRESCNLDMRVSMQSMPEDRGVSTEFVAEDLETLMSEGSELIVIHFDNLDIAATDKSDPRADFSANSVPYAAQMYLVDSIVGQVAAIAKDRSVHFKENWLVMGVSDHGGLDGSSGTHRNDDEVVAFFANAMTSFGHLQLSAPSMPTWQMDIAPTILKWFDLLGNEPGMIRPKQFDGRVQGICSSGKDPKPCGATGYDKA